MNTERLGEYVKSLEKKHNQLLVNIKGKLPELERLLEEISSHWG
jgi:CMP-2-keto-3-deoxyoctulosonic acid synthetase